MSDSHESEINPQTLAETANFIAWYVQEPDGEKTFHLELNNVTLHFFTEEWKELLDLIRSIE